MSTRRKYFLVGMLIVVVTVIATAILYPHLPERVPRHWDFAGHVNGWGSRASQAIIIPVSMLGAMALFAALPWLSPRKMEIERDSTGYLWTMLGLVSMLSIIHLAVLANAVGISIDVTRVVLGAVCLFFACLSRVLPRIRRNFYIGVRTPWTLANDKVWQATHQFAAHTFLAAGVLGVAFTFLTHSFWPATVMLCAGGMAPAIYSLIYYKQLEHRGEV
jgi:uncharacterized membrane protein